MKPQIDVIAKVTVCSCIRSVMSACVLMSVDEAIENKRGIIL